MSSNVSHSEYHLILNFLFNLYDEKDYNEDIKIDYIFEFFPQTNSIYKLDTSLIYENDKSRLNNWFLIKLNILGEDLWLSAKSLIDIELSLLTKIFYEIRFFPLNEKTNMEIDFLDKLKTEAILKSKYHCRVLKLCDGSDTSSIIDLIKVISPKNISLNDIYIPETKKKYLELYIDTAVNYDGITFTIPFSLEVPVYSYYQ